MRKLLVYIVSDSLGETAEHVVKAVIRQFRPSYEDVELRKFPRVSTLANVRAVVQEAASANAFIAYTLVEKELRQQLYHLCVERQVHAIDLLGPFMDFVEEKFHETPLQKPGIVYQLDDQYFRKIEAIEFAVKYDDGRDPRGILLADIVLVGVSRTSKTPLSQYLAHKSYKVANVPVMPEVDPPEELFKVDPKKCFGLSINVEQLNSIRRERLLVLGLKEEAVYAQKQRIEEEMVHFSKIVEKVGCQVVDVTNKAIEESANLILELYEQQNKGNTN